MLIIILGYCKKYQLKGAWKKALCDFWRILSKLGLKYLPANVTDYSGFNCCLKKLNLLHVVFSFQWLEGISMLVTLQIFQCWLLVSFPKVTKGFTQLVKDRQEWKKHVDALRPLYV